MFRAADTWGFHEGHSGGTPHFCTITWNKSSAFGYRYRKKATWIKIPQTEKINSDFKFKL